MSELPLTLDSTFAGEKAGWATARLDAPISVAEVERLLEPWRGGRAVTEAAFLAGGLMNRNYRVRVGDDEVVLRFYDRDSHACAKETALYRELRGTVAVPEVFYVAPESAPVPFAVLELIHGISLRDLARRGDARAVDQAAYDVGLQLASLAPVQLRDPQILIAGSDADAVDDSILRGSNVNARLIDRFLESPLLRARLGAEHVTRVHDFAWQRDDRLSTTAPPCAISHGDFNSANILVREEASEWRVAALLDWEFAFAGSVYYDIGNLLRYERSSRPRYAPGFTRGLADGGLTLPDDWRTIARVADLGALCELLTRAAAPPHVADEVAALVRTTIDGRDLEPS